MSSLRLLTEKKFALILICGMILSILAPSTLFAAESRIQQFKLFPGNVSTYPEFIASFYRFSIPMSILIAVVLIMIGGVIWITSAGDQGRIAKAREFIINPIIGIVILMGAYVILALINPNLVNLSAVAPPEIGKYGACIDLDGKCLDFQTQKECEAPKTFRENDNCESSVSQAVAIQAIQAQTPVTRENLCVKQSQILTKAQVPALPEIIWADDCSTWCQSVPNSETGKECRINPVSSSCAKSSWGSCDEINCVCIYR